MTKVFDKSPNVRIGPSAGKGVVGLSLTAGVIEAFVRAVATVVVAVTQPSARHTATVVAPAVKHEIASVT